jgi:hypothetical protein
MNIENDIKLLGERITALEKVVRTLDKEPGITWTQIGDLEWSSELGEMNWFKAKETCESVGGRLPARIELFDLYDNHYEEMVKLLNNQPSHRFWSATESSSAVAWYVALGYGYTYGNAKSTALFQVRCVR